MKKILLMLLMTALVFSCEILNAPLEEGETASLVGKALFLNQADNSGIVISVEKTDGLRSISSGSRSVVASTTTDSDGSYTIENLEAGTYTLYASSKDSSEKAVSRNNVVVDTRVVTVDDLYLTPVGSIEGTILVDGDTDDSIGTLISIAGTSYMSTANAIGEFVISDVPVGSDYTLVMTKGIDLYIMENTISVSAGEVTEVGSINITLSNNQQGETPIVGIDWQGSLTEAPTNPETNWAYYNEAEGISYIYDGYEWQIIAQDGSDGQDGADGQSTYDLWVSLGNEGSEQDFLDSLQGSDGMSAYDIWIIVGNVGTHDDFLADIAGADGIDGVDGSNGLSAYEIWLISGNEGTEADFLTSLQGSDGTDGTNGTDGTDGQSAYEIWLTQGNEGNEAQFIESLNGEDGQDGQNGLSAYEIWLSLGYEGTEQDFIDSLSATGEEDTPVVTDANLEGVYWTFLRTYTTFDMVEVLDEYTPVNPEYYLFHDGLGSFISYDVDTATYEDQIVFFYELAEGTIALGEGSEILMTYAYSISGSTLQLIMVQSDEEDRDQDGDTVENIYGVVEFELTDQAIIDNLDYICEINFMHTNFDGIYNQSVQKGGLVTQPEDPVKEGFVFIGWFTDKDLTNEWNFENDTVNSSMVLYAGFAPESLEPYISASPYFNSATAAVGDTVTLVVPLGNDDDITRGYCYPTGYNGDPIDSVSLSYDSDLDAWVGELAITQYYPETVAFDQISFYTSDDTDYTFWPNDYTSIDLIITNSTPDTTAPILNSVSFSVESATVGDTVYVYADFSDPETGLRENWSSWIYLENTDTGWDEGLSFMYNSYENRYEGEFTITEDFPTTVTIQDLWAKNGVGITTRPQAGTDFTSPVLTIN